MALKTNEIDPLYDYKIFNIKYDIYVYILEEKRDQKITLK